MIRIHSLETKRDDITLFYQIEIFKVVAQVIELLAKRCVQLFCTTQNEQ